MGLLQGVATLDFLIFIKPETLAVTAAVPTVANSDGDEDDWDTFNAFLDSSVGRKLMMAASTYAPRPAGVEACPAR